MKKTTSSIEFKSSSNYYSEYSDSHSNLHYFAYRIRMKNVGKKPVRLLSFQMVITHFQKKWEWFRRAGAAGKKPHIPVGDFFEYNSFCILEAKGGSLKGAYVFQEEGGSCFCAKIPPIYFCPFSLQKRYPLKTNSPMYFPLATRF